MDIPLGLSFDDVLLVPQRSDIASRTLISLRTQLAKNFFLDVPIIATNMVDVTGVDMAIAMSKLGALAFMHRFTTIEIQAKQIETVKKAGQRVFATIGLREQSDDRAIACVKAGADGLLLDLPHAHMSHTLVAIRAIKQKFKKLPLIAGTVATYEGAYDLFEAGADCIKVGIGAGSICTTRIQTGCGVPQITAVMEAARARKKFKHKFILSDAGIKTSGDIVKALGAGADCVSCGNFLAGTDEAPGDIKEINGKMYKEYEGSTSYNEKVKQADAVGTMPKHFKIHVEGVSGLVPYKGSVVDIIENATAGVRSGLSYCGANTIAELHKKAKFMRVTGAGIRESNAHDIHFS